MKESARGQKGIWMLFGGVLGLVVGAGATGFFMVHQAWDGMNYPPPNHHFMTAFQHELDRDGIKLKADILVAVDADNYVFVGEGDIPDTWQALLDAQPASEVPGEPGKMLLETKDGDFAKIMDSGEHRARIVAGRGLTEKEANEVFAREFHTGRGRYPDFNLYAYEKVSGLSQPKDKR